ncbi:TPA: hypothetical protein U2K06_002810 [Legionella pneumophila]|nr:hypothetical protein [Legionella pneumophila]
MIISEEQILFLLQATQALGNLAEEGMFGYFGNIKQLKKNMPAVVNMLRDIRMQQSKELKEVGTRLTI